MNEWIKGEVHHWIVKSKNVIDRISELIILINKWIATW